MTASPFYGWNRKKPAKPWGWNGSTSRNLSILAFFALCVIVAGCLPLPEEEQYDDSCLRALGGGRAVDISPLNEANHIYTMITAQPFTKLEGDLPYYPVYQYNCTITTRGLSQIAPGLAPDTSKVAYTGFPAYQKQVRLDQELRAKENSLLASGARQVSRQTATRGPIDIVIDEGTPWDVYITITGATINTICVDVSESAYFFVDIRNIDQAMIDRIASYTDTFDSIYNVLHEKFGTENNVDNIDPVFIVFSQELSGGLLGYFNPSDKFPQAEAVDSNEGDIIYITTDDYPGNIIPGTLAHELQHMIYFDQHYNYNVPSTYIWLNEALSQAAEYYCTYTDNHDLWIQWFLDGGWYGLSLTHWTQVNYGFGAVFIRYLIEQYGDQAIKKMCSTGNVGITAVEIATGSDFNTLFNDFTRALVMSGTGDSTNPRYNFTELNLQAVQPNGRGGLTTTDSFDRNIDGMLPPYSLFFAEWTGDYGTMTLSGDSVVGTVFGLSR